MLRARASHSDLRGWLVRGGLACLDSYGSTGQIDLIPRRHFDFLESCRTYFETERHFFAHANYQPDVSLDRLDIYTLRWLSLRDYVPPRPHCFGKVAIVGHTPQRECLDLGYLKCLDTGCYGGWRSTCSKAPPARSRITSRWWLRLLPNARPGSCSSPTWQACRRAGSGRLTTTT